MIDPITGSAVGGIANAVGSAVIQKIVKGENDHDKWKEEAIETATRAETARQFCLETAEKPQRGELEDFMRLLGKEAKKLEVIGERRGYDTCEVQTVAELAQVCTSYATTTKMNNLDEEDKLADNLPPVVEEVYTFVE